MTTNKYQKGNKVLVKPFTTEDPKRATVIGLPHETSSNKYEVDFGQGWVGFFEEHDIANENITLRDAYKAGYSAAIKNSNNIFRNAMKNAERKLNLQ